MLEPAGVTAFRAAVAEAGYPSTVEYASVHGPGAWVLGWDPPMPHVYGERARDIAGVSAWAERYRTSDNAWCRATVWVDMDNNENGTV